MGVVIKEWLETDGLGGFACGTDDCVARRRYHSLLISAVPGIPSRVATVNNIDVKVKHDGREYDLSSHMFSPGVLFPDSTRKIESFDHYPWPRWDFKISDGLSIRYELFMRRGVRAIFLKWRLLSEDSQGVVLSVRPLISGRSYHKNHRLNSACDPATYRNDIEVFWQTYSNIPVLSAYSNTKFSEKIDWYYEFMYTEEQARGFHEVEDLVSPGYFSWNLSEKKEAWLVFSVDKLEEINGKHTIYKYHHKQELKRRTNFSSPLDKAVEDYLVDIGGRKTIVAGYPWFIDWGRYAFISIRGLLLARGELEKAGEILTCWSSYLSEGMMPNTFCEDSDEVFYNSVDSSLWFIIAAYEFLSATEKSNYLLDERIRTTIISTIETIVTFFICGTRYRILCEPDGLLRVGVSDTSVTWMDVVVDGHQVSSRIGKPVEVQALWINALWIYLQLFDDKEDLFQNALNSFRDRFWNEQEQCLFDCVDSDHVSGVLDSTIRPNQILAMGGLPLKIITGERAKKALKVIEDSLLTPFGLRSLDRKEPGYNSHYEGNVKKRDLAYHEGTVWSWLLGSFIEAHLNVNGSTIAHKKELREKYLAHLESNISDSGLGHLSEIYDGEEPYTPRGCPFSAAALGEYIRIKKLLEA